MEKYLKSDGLVRLHLSILKANTEGNNIPGDHYERAVKELDAMKVEQRKLISIIKKYENG